MEYGLHLAAGINSIDGGTLYDWFFIVFIVLEQYTTFLYRGAPRRLRPMLRIAVIAGKQLLR